MPVSESNSSTTCSIVVTALATRVLATSVKLAPIFLMISLNNFSLCRSHGMLRPLDPCLRESSPKSADVLGPVRGSPAGSEFVKPPVHTLISYQHGNGPSSIAVNSMARDAVWHKTRA